MHTSHGRNRAVFYYQMGRYRVFFPRLGRKKERKIDKVSGVVGDLFLVLGVKASMNVNERRLLTTIY